MNERKEFLVRYDWKDKSGNVTAGDYWGPYRAIDEARREAEICSKGSHRFNIRIEVRTVTEAPWEECERIEQANA